jgi:hypothetical protein
LDISSPALVETNIWTCTGGQWEVVACDQHLKKNARMYMWTCNHHNSAACTFSVAKIDRERREIEELDRAFSCSCAELGLKLPTRPCHCPFPGIGNNPTCWYMRAIPCTCPEFLHVYMRITACSPELHNR